MNVGPVINEWLAMNHESDRKQENTRSVKRDRLSYARHVKGPKRVSVLASDDR